MYTTVFSSPGVSIGMNPADTIPSMFAELANGPGVVDVVAEKTLTAPLLTVTSMVAAALLSSSTKYVNTPSVILTGSIADASHDIGMGASHAGNAIRSTTDFSFANDLISNAWSSVGDDAIDHPARVALGRGEMALDICAQTDDASGRCAT